MDQTNQFGGFALWLGGVLAGDVKAPFEYLLGTKPTLSEIEEARECAQLVAHAGLQVEYREGPPRFVVSQHALDPNPPPLLEQYPIALVNS